MPILAVIAILWILALQLGLIWWAALVVAIALPLSCLILAYALALLFFSDRSILRFESVKELLTWEDCDDCTAGAQWWDGTNWGPIPLHVRQMAEGGKYIESAQANIRACSNCMGSGGWWRSQIGKL